MSNQQFAMCNGGSGFAAGDGPPYGWLPNAPEKTFCLSYSHVYP